MRLLTALLTCLLLARPLTAAEVAEAPEHTAMGYSEAIILGVVEGITEYLPISSTGHLIITNEVLGLNSTAPATDASGAPILVREDGVERPYTRAEAANAYAIVIQGGAILAVCLLYWRRILDVLLGFLGKKPEGRRLGYNLLAAFLPAALLGPLLDDWIESKLFFTESIAVALACGALLMFWAEARRRKQPEQDAEAGPDLHELPLKACLLIGLAQCVAMWPGVSRSMMTIVGGSLVGLSMRRAAEFSFLLGLITLSAASGYKCLTSGREMVQALELGPVLLGLAVATISAALAVKWLVGFLTKHGMGAFAWYRLALAGVLVVLLQLDYL